MANAFIKAQFMEPPGPADGAVPVGAVKAGDGVAISAEGVISVTRGGGTINNIICTNGIQGGGGDPQVFIGLLPPTETTIGGVYTVDGSGISIDSNGLIRASLSFGLQAGPGIVLSNVTPESATISTSPAGVTEATRGTVFFEPTNYPGLDVDARGAIKLLPPIGTGIGGVRAGTGVTIDPVTGVLNATGTGGTITAVGAGTGLGGGGTTGAVSLFLKPPSGTTIGGVYAGENVIIDADGKLNVSDASLGVLTVNATEPVFMSGTATNPIVNVRSGSVTQQGVVTLLDSVTSTSIDVAATPNSVREAYNLADAALPRTGGQLTGLITFQAGQAFPGTVESGAFTQTGGLLVGDTSPPGYAQLPVGSNGQVLTANTAAPLGVEWTNNGTGTVTSVTGEAPIQVATGTSTPVISITAATVTDPGAVQLENSVTSISETTAPTSLALSLVNTVAEAALPTAGGTMTGAITFAGAQTFPGVLPLGGGTLTGAVTFAAGQTFPGVLADGSISGTGALEVGGTPDNPVLSVDTATTAQLGVVQPDGTTITIDGNGVISAAGAGTTGTLQTVTDAGSTTTNPISVVGGGFTNLADSQSVTLTQNGGSTLEIFHDGSSAYLSYNETGVNFGSLTFDLADGTTLTSGTSADVTINSGNSVIFTTADGVGSTITFNEFDGVVVTNGGGLQCVGLLKASGLSYPTSDGTIGQVLTTDGAGNLGWSTAQGISASLLDVTGDMVYASATNTPASLPIGANGSILAVNAGLPAWRSTAQLNLLTNTAASATYAPLDTPTFSGPVTVNASGGAGANALIVAGGNLVLSTSYTPGSSTDTGSTGELAWDANFLYFCYAPNSWGRVAVDLTPF